MEQETKEIITPGLIEAFTLTQEAFEEGWVLSEEVAPYMLGWQYSVTLVRNDESKKQLIKRLETAVEDKPSFDMGAHLAKARAAKAQKAKETTDDGTV